MAKTISGFAPRKPQQEMADAVYHCLQQAEVLIAEAGTGVGKTFAYLVPALLNGQRVIISTGTRHLQDQLFHRDLPRVQTALGAGLQTALLKGRNNYLCLHRLAQADRGVYDNDELSKIDLIRSWSRTTHGGEIAEVSQIAENDSIWSRATSTTDNCLGSDCPEFNQCHLVKARRLAQEADVVVVNHHLFFADMALKDDGFGEILPSADAFILDEAHQLPDTASRFFGESTTARQLDLLVQDTIAAQVNDVPEHISLREMAETLKQATREMRLALGASLWRDSWAVIANKPQVKQAFEQLQQGLQALNDELAEVADFSPDLEKCKARSGVLLNCLQLFAEPQQELILWFDTNQYGFALHATPVDVGSLFSQYMQRFQAAWVFTSATLAVADTFAHFQQRMGIEDATCRQFDSPFDYASNALLYLPEHIPDPNSNDFVESLIDKAVPVLQASKGRAFMLFTSHRALQMANRILQSKVSNTLYVQGDMPRSQLLDEFRQSGDGILLGTSSFWEGVDIRGEALSCVIIDRLPFAAPNDPVLKARLDLIRERGGVPFMEYQLPQAVIALKQGIGRLIRDVNDRGVLMIADPRLRTKSYGRVFIQSLPEMPITSDIQDVKRFFKEN